MKKYDFTGKTENVCGVTLHQIVALRDFGDVKAGDVGGWIMSEKNLSHDGDAWVCDNAVVRDSALICDNAVVRANAIVRDGAWVRDNALVYGSAVVRDNAWVRDSAIICGKMLVDSTKILITISRLGNLYGCTTFAKDIDGNIVVSCRDFYGTTDEFSAEMSETAYAKEYEAAIELAKIHIGDGQ